MIRENGGFLSDLGMLYMYPGPDYVDRARRVHERLEEMEAGAAEEFKQFLDFIKDFSLEQLEEVFTRTFDLNPVSSPELGWHLFGEDYNRGLFLAKMRRELKKAGIEESKELPDHISHALQLLERMETDKAEEFTTSCVLPALKKMLRGFEGKENGFEPLVRATESILAGEREFAARESRYG